MLQSAHYDVTALAKQATDLSSLMVVVHTRSRHKIFLADGALIFLSENHCLIGFLSQPIESLYPGESAFPTLSISSSSGPHFIGILALPLSYALDSCHKYNYEIELSNSVMIGRAAMDMARITGWARSETPK